MTNAAAVTTHISGPPWDPRERGVYALRHLDGELFKGGFLRVTQSMTLPNNSTARRAESKRRTTMGGGGLLGGTSSAATWGER